MVSLLLSDWLAVPFVIYLGLRTSFDDIRHSKIRNRSVAAGLAAGLAFHLLVVVTRLSGIDNGFFMPYGPAVYLFHLTTNLALMFAVTFLLWYFNFMTAADAKLLVAFSLLMPFGFYSRTFIPIFPSFALFFNSFIALFVLLLVEIVHEAVQTAHSPERLRRLAREVAGADPWVAVRMVVVFMFMWMAIMVFRRLLSEEIRHYLALDRFGMYIILFAIYVPLHRYLLRTRYVVVFLAAIFGHLLYEVLVIGNIEYITQMLHMTALVAGLVIFIVLYSYYLKIADVREVAPDALRARMMLTEETLGALKTHPAFDPDLIGAIYPEGLSELQVENLRGWYAGQTDASDVPKLMTTRSVAFAPCIFAGAVMTIAVRGLVVVI